MRLEINSGGLDSFYAGVSQFLYLANGPNGLTSGLQNIINKTNDLEGGVGTLSTAIASLQTRIVIEENRRDAIETVKGKTDAFISTAIEADNRAADTINASTEEFYQVNPWARPDSPAWYEQIWGGIVDVASVVWDGIVYWYEEPVRGIIDGFGEVLLGITSGVSFFISGISNTVYSTANENYENNINFEFDGFIYTQKEGAASKQKMGGRYADYNGCAWIATYNTLLRLGEPVHPADIIKHYETHGGSIINGEFGINPLSIREYFKKQGFDPQMQNLPPSVDERIKNSTVSILTYAHSSGAHTVMIYYENGLYYIYNDNSVPGWTSSAPGITISVDEWIKGNIRGEGVSNKSFHPISVITLQQESTT